MEIEIKSQTIVFVATILERLFGDDVPVEISATANGAALTAGSGTSAATLPLATARVIEVGEVVAEVGSLIRAALDHKCAERGFRRDFDAMMSADACVLVLPCGRSAHLEAGWMKGAGKKVIAYIPPGYSMTPELMYKMLDGITSSRCEMLSWLQPRTTDECRPGLIFLDESYVEKVRAK